MKKMIGLIGGGAAALLALVFGVKKIKNKPKKVKMKDPNEDLMKTFEEFAKECRKSTESAMIADRLMNNLQEELEQQMGINPDEINIELYPQEAGA